MRKFLSFSFFLIFFLIGCDYINNSIPSSSNISKEEVLKKFKKGFSDAIPDDALVSITALRDSPIQGLKEGAILFKKLDKTQQLSFLISNDGTYIILNPNIYDFSGPSRNEEIMKNINLSNAPSRGPKDSKPIEIVEYSDFQCPACKFGAIEIIPELKKRYGEKITFYYKHLPLTFHRWADDAAYYTACIHSTFGNEQFWLAHDLIFNSQSGIKEESFKEDIMRIFTESSVEFPYDKCLRSYSDKKYVSIVDSDLAESRLLGINSTPTFVINGYIVSGTDFMKIVEAIEKFSQ